MGMAGGGVVTVFGQSEDNDDESALLAGRAECTHRLKDICKQFS